MPPGGTACDAAPRPPLYREKLRPGGRRWGVLAEVCSQVGLEFRREGSANIASGSTAVFEALAGAKRLLAAERTRGCLIVAVDSLVDARALRWLDQGKRLRTALNPNGVTPGEAAGVALVTSGPISESLVAVRGLGFAVETATVLNNDPLLGIGMTAAIRNALRDAGLAMHNVDFRLSDVAGESYAFEELVLAQTRLTRQPREFSGAVAPSVVDWRLWGSLGTGPIGVGGAGS